MEDSAITLKNIGKAYRLYEKPVHRLKELLFRREYHNRFVALEGISIAVREGETLGIIGENGAGKSTLLKIIANTLTPTEGEVAVRGRIASLLELGSGFHPEFTGIDNIYFYGSLLGISPADMRERMEEIVSFAEIGQYINYPLKTYSSGMYVRLAFSVAMAVRPDILVVDEALSVGDLYFQKRSTDRILQFKESGKTIIFCSHSMYYVNRLCDRVIWLQNGRIRMEGSPHEVTQAYETYQLTKEKGVPEIEAPDSANACTEAPLVLIRNILVTPHPMVRCGSDLKIEIELSSRDKALAYRAAATLKRIDEMNIIGIGSKELEPFHGDAKVSLCFPSLQLKEGTFFIKVYAMDENFVHIFDTKASPPFTIPKETPELGFFNMAYRWTRDS